jgi:hypothetical protein
MINNIVSSTENVLIKEGSENSYKTGSKTVFWNTNSTNKIPTEMGFLLPKSFISLGHELAHAEDHVKGTINTSLSWTSKKYPQAEKFATHRENQIRGELGMPLRTTYGVIKSTSGAYSQDNQSKIMKNGFSLFYPMKVGPYYIPYLYKK